LSGSHNRALSLSENGEIALSEIGCRLAGNTIPHCCRQVSPESEDHIGRTFVATFVAIFVAIFVATFAATFVEKMPDSTKAATKIATKIQKP
jgi:hypothetical protein